MKTLSRLRLRADLSTSVLTLTLMLVLVLATWAWPVADALACPAGGGTCSIGTEEPASLPLASSLNVGAGNPINVMSGNKYLREEDMPALPGVLGLEIVRHYNSIVSGVRAPVGIIGRGWKLSYETQLLVATGGMQIVQADGAVSNFSRDVLRPTVAVGSNPANGIIRAERRKGREEYVWHWTDGRELTFDHRGKLMQIRAATGEVASLLYDARGLLVKVTDPQGRSLRLAYLDRETARRADRFRGVQSIDSPVGRFTYDHGSSAPQGSGTDRRVLLASLVAVSHPDGSQMRQYHYEDARYPTYLTGISIGAERFATYAYDAIGKGVLSTHANGSDKVTLDFSRPGMTVVTNSLGQETRYRFALQDDDYRLAEVRGPGCAWCGPGDRRYDYNRAGQLVETTGLDAQGVPQQTVRTDVDYLGRPVRVTRRVYGTDSVPASRLVSRYEYADQRTTRPTLVAWPSVVAGREALRRIAYNAAGQPVSVKERGWSPAVGGEAPGAIERTTLYRYRVVQGRSLLAEIDGPLPNGKTATPADSDITRFEYDQGGSYVTRTVAPGNVVTEVRERDSALRPLMTVSTDGVRMLSVEERLAPSGQVLKRIESAWLLDDKGQADPGTRQVNVLEYRYDGQGRLQTALAPGGGMTRYRYDGAGNLTQRIAPDGSSVTHTFDTERQLTAETRHGPAAGSGITWRYGAEGRSDSAAAATLDWRTGRIDERWPDATQPWTARHQLGAADTASEGLVEEVTRPDGSQVRRWFDDFGRIVATRSPEQGLRLARYDNAGNVVALRDGVGVTTTVRRDAQGRALEVRYADATARVQQQLTLRYAGIALAEETRFERGAVDSRITWLSDAWGRTSGKQLTIFGAQGKPAPTLVVGSTIDREDQAVRRTLPSGAELSYHYDAAGNVGRIELDGHPLLSDIRHTMTLTGLRPTAFEYANGRRSETRYNADGTLASHLTGTDLFTATHDPASRSSRFQRTAVPLAATAQAAGGWASVISSWIGTAHAAAPPPASIAAPVSMTYDTHGRLVREQRGGHDAFAVEYDSLGNRGGTAAASIDGIGNVLASGKLRLAYNAAGELQRVTDERGVERAAYRYDARGHRIAKQAGGETRYFMYDDGQLLAEADAAGRVVAEYVYLGRRPVARLRYDASPRGWLPGSRLKPVIEYLHTDQRDAVATITAADGHLLWRGELDAFGVLRAETGAAGSMPLRLAGQYADRETGLYYNVHRYYDPAQGRYLQADPLGLAAGLNMYAYTGNDPLNKTDPLGLNPEPDDGWAGIVQPWLFGTFVHSAFARQVRLFGPGWGANDGRDGTWKDLRPDAYFVEPGNDKVNYTGKLWELKPITWASGSKYGAGLAEVLLYKSEAKTGCWSAGSSSSLANRLTANKIFMGNATYEVNYVADEEDGSGLIFYAKKKLETKPEPKIVPAPALSKKDSDELARQMQAVRNQGKKEGWSTLLEIGMLVLIGVAIAAAIAVAVVPASIGAIISAIAGAIAAAASGAVTLLAAIAAVFALGTGVAAAAEAKGKEKEQGLLDGAIGWFKSWF